MAGSGDCNGFGRVFPLGCGGSAGDDRQTLRDWVIRYNPT
jgi:hypothetical protein